MTISQETRNAVRDATRQQIQAILESNGFGVYDSEPTEDLRSSLMHELETGIIDEDDVHNESPTLMDPRDR